jgi:acyl carrier protein
LWSGVDTRDDFVAPRTPTEEAVAEIFAELLRVVRISVHDSFFDLGGHSLLAAQLVSRLHQLLQVEISLSTVFEAPTVGALATQVEALRRQAASDEAQPEPVPVADAVVGVPGELPVSEVRIHVTVTAWWWLVAHARELGTTGDVVHVSRGFA